MKDQKTNQVENTNNYSIESKYSTVLNKYVHDDYIKYFIDTGRKIRRSPIINMGYYIRCKAMEWAFERVKPDLVVSLGAGFDTSALRYPAIKFVEVDLPTVANRKVKVLIDNGLVESYQLEPRSQVILRNTRYSLIGADLRQSLTFDLIVEEVRLMASGAKNVRVMILNECCFCYLLESDANDIIGHLTTSLLDQDLVECVNYVGYEHLKPHQREDDFSKCMLAHFVKMNSPLRTFPSKDEQLARFQGVLKFQRVEVLDMVTFYEQFVGNDEKLRLTRLEPFDEFEEFYLVCSCYALTVAQLRKTRADNNWPLVNARSPWTCREEVTTDLKVSLTSAPNFMQRFGQASTKCTNSNRIVIFGGCGLATGSNRHERHFDVNWYDTSSGQFGQCSIKLDDGVKMPSGRVFSQLVQVRDDMYYLSGGRESPSSKCITSYVLTDTGEDEFKLSGSVNDTFMGWRHTLVKCTGDQVVRIGGRQLASCSDSSTCDVLSLDRMQWTAKCGHESITARHSHASTRIDDNSILISGGLELTCSNIIESNSIIDLRSRDGHLELGNLPFTSGLFGHDVHSLNANTIAFIGGISWRGSHNRILLYDIRNMCVISDCAIVNNRADQLTMLHNFVSEWDDSGKSVNIFGGGGNCFSFGTHFNENVINVAF